MGKFDLSTLGVQMGPVETRADNKSWLIYGPPGSGKGHPYGTPVLTINGWRAVETLGVGDYLIGSDGQPQRLLGVFDRGEQDIYCVTFSDGASVETDAEHLWQITTSKRSKVILTTEQLREAAAQGARVHIPRVAAVDHPEATVPVDPYLLGALLADGYLHGDSIQYTKNDEAVASAVGAAAYSDGYTLDEVTRGGVRQWKFRDNERESGHNRRLGQALKGLGLRVPSGEKFIPGDYYITSIEQRTDLVHGLFDGDGRVSSKGQPLYHTTSEQLAHDVQQLLWSLGVGAHIQKRKTDGTWCVSVVSEYNPFYASEYRVRVALKRAHERRLVSVEPVGRKEDRCLWVENGDSLYVTKDYILTHNTRLAASCSEVPELSNVLVIDYEDGSASIENSPEADLSRLTVIRPTDWAESKSVLEAVLNEDHDFQTIILDTAGKMMEYMLPVAEKRSGKNKFDMWRFMAEDTLEIIEKLHRSGRNVITLAHLDRDKDEMSGKVSIFPYFLGQKTGKEAPKIFDVIGYLYVTEHPETGDPLRVLQTEGMGDIVAKDRTDTLPVHFGAPTMAKAYAYISAGIPGKGRTQDTDNDDKNDN